MTPDLTARIEAAARECAEKTVPTNVCGRPQWVRDDEKLIAACLTTLAEQIISEKDAEAAAMRAASGLCARIETRQSP